jgi:hypothetical protein
MPGNSPDAGAGWLPGLAPRRMRLRGVASVAQLGRTFNARRRPGRGGTDQRSASTVIATRQWCLQPRAHAAAPSAGRARAPPSIGGTAVRVAERAPMLATGPPGSESSAHCRRCEARAAVVQAAAAVGNRVWTGDFPFPSCCGRSLRRSRRYCTPLHATGRSAAGLPHRCDPWDVVAENVAAKEPRGSAC